MKKFFFSFAIIVAALGFTNANAAETKINQQEQKTVTVSAKDASEYVALEAKQQVKLGGYICYTAKVEVTIEEGMDGTLWEVTTTTTRCFWCYSC